MSKRQEDFDKAANEYAEKMCAEYHGDDADKRISKYEFLNGAEHGYQYAKKRLREVLGFELDFNVAEFDDGVTTESLVDKICKRMEE